MTTLELLQKTINIQNAKQAEKQEEKFTDKSEKDLEELKKIFGMFDK
jgi:hypothetical protein